jgi:uncharacterized membrane protein YecN with MAPEG domain
LFILGGAGVILIAATLGLGWSTIHTVINPWTIAGHEYYFEATSTFLPGADYRTQCSTNNTSLPGFGLICAQTGSHGYLSPYLAPIIAERDLYDLYQGVATAIVATAALGIVGLLLHAIGVRRTGHGTDRWRRVGSSLLLVAGVLAIALPVAVAVLQPLAAAHDFSAAGGVGPNPLDSSFWGSCSPMSTHCPGQNTTESWGAGAGWYVALGSGVCLLAAGAIGWKLKPPSIAVASPLAVENPP